MKQIVKLSSLLIFSLFIFKSILGAEKNYFNEAVNLFEKKKFEKAKFKFEQDIVFNPKNHNSYLYLSKIFNKQENIDQEESNLNTVILINPQNEEATLALAKLKLKKSNFSETQKLISKFKKICKVDCSKSLSVEKDLKNSLIK
ncbi:MAG: hypothetical protein CBD76_00675 [Pelagibacteraceae bacterium TMED216]|nr:MAG: hypothetical protein CBD76_00675 [Pelagibacteraceae bacterium TMED216]|tara:strand:+ start:672 stop:1103 length:432 start_codon:yes stop_codon:yes gene_type:complete